jgi:hypothetical protein
MFDALVMLVHFTAIAAGFSESSPSRDYLNCLMIHKLSMICAYRVELSARRHMNL